MIDEEIKFTEGDLVEISNVTYSDWNTVSTVISYGFVVKTPEKLQQSLFPQVNIYLIKTGKIQAFSRRIVKIISPYSTHIM